MKARFRSKILLLLLSLCSHHIILAQDSLAQQRMLERMDSTLAFAQSLLQKLEVAALQLTRDSVKREELKNQLEEINQLQLSQSSALGLEQLQATRERIASQRTRATAYPVMGFFRDTLFLLHERSGSLSPEDRAKQVSQKIYSLRRKADSESLRMVRDQALIDVLFEDQIIISISEADAIWNNTNIEDLAYRYKATIGAALDKHKKATGWLFLLKEIGLVLLVIVLFYYAVQFVNRFFRWALVRVARQENKKIKGVTVKNYTFLDASRQVSLLLQSIRILRWAVLLLLVYVTLPVLFSIFPWTRNIAETLFGYVLNPLKAIFGGVWNYLPNLFTIAVIFLVFRYIVKGMNYLKEEVANEKLQISGFYPDWANPTYQILRVLLYAFMFILIFPYLPGSESPIFQGVSVFLGFLFTLSSAGSLSNIIAGLVLTYMRVFKVGDRVKIGEVSGDILEKTLLVTRIRTTKNEIISIPNATVMSSHTINYSSEATGKGLIVHTTITLGYDVPWKLVYQTLREAANRTENLLKDPAPFVLQTGLEDFYVSYQLNAYTQNPEKQALIYSDLHQHIQDCCRESGIEILSPHYQAERDGNASTIPAS